MERRLATIMAGDVVGYSAQMGASETDTLARLARVREIVGDRVVEKAGRIFSQAGDGFLAEFSSPVSAVRAGFDIQRDLASQRQHDGGVLELRIGIHTGPVVIGPKAQWKGRCAAPTVVVNKGAQINGYFEITGKATSSPEW